MLETVIRPFESRRVVSTARLVSSSKKQAAQLSTITWGAAGAMPVPFADIVPTGVSFQIDKGALQHLEVYRITDQIRIENPDNSSDFVDVQRIKKIGFTAKPTTPLFQTSTVDAATGVTIFRNSGLAPVSNDYQLKNV